MLRFDGRKLEVLGHRVRLADGVCQVNLRTADGVAARLEAIPDPRADRLWVRIVREDGLAFFYQKLHATVKSVDPELLTCESVFVAAAV